MLGHGQDQEALESLWWSKLQAALACYKDAKTEYLRAFKEQQKSEILSPDCAFVTRAQNIEYLARSEYMRVLRIYTDLVVRGKVPPEE